MSLPPSLAKVLPPATQRAWARIAPLVPESAYLVGGTAIAVHLLHRSSRDLDFLLESPEDLEALAAGLDRVGNLVVTTLQSDTLNALLDDARLRFLLADDQRVLEPVTTIEGIRVAGIGDLLATELNVLTRRGELRDYFDIMTIETKARRLTEEGLGLFVARYQPSVPEDAIGSIVRALGYMGDVADDLQLPVKRSAIEKYWKRRQAVIVRHLDRHAEVFSRIGVRSEHPGAKNGVGSNQHPYKIGRAHV